VQGYASVRHAVGMGELRPDERWAAALMSAHLGCPVVQHDDGSKSGMYDLDVHRPDGPVGACEVTAAMHAQDAAFWRATKSGARWTEPDLAGGWIVNVRTSASVRDLRKQLPNRLRRYEAAGDRFPLVEWDCFSKDDDLAALGVTSATQSNTDFPGSIYVLPALDDRHGGFVPDHSNSLPAWLTHWTAEPAQADNLRKLGQSGALERHLFVIVPAFTVAPHTVTDILISDGPAPEDPPDLPIEVTDVWAMSTWAIGVGYHWSAASGWQPVIKQL
jgi:hypothetical protein